MIKILHKNSDLSNYKNWEVVDLTSRSKNPFWIKFSPFYPHGNIPVTLSENWYSESVEGIWQGLKVFHFEDIDTSKFKITTMKNLKRNGISIGHRAGVKSKKILNLVDARNLIYLPTYNYVMDKHLKFELQMLSKLAKFNNIVLLDFETNEDVNDTSSSLSHASIVKQRVYEIESNARLNHNKSILI